MFQRPLRKLFIVAACCAAPASLSRAQNFGIPVQTNAWQTNIIALDGIQTAQMDFNLFMVNTQDPNGTQVQGRSGSQSQLDLKAPWKAQREYDKGYQLLLKKDLQGAVEHLSKSTTIYPSYVAAHNALGTAYLDLSENEKARDEFSQAVKLDDHLPNSFLNLGIAQLALKAFPDAEESLRKASSIAPLDLQLSTALAYSEFANHDYPAVIATAKEVHKRKHKGAEMVHYSAAGALAAQSNLTDAQHEIETLLLENPKSASADQFRQALEELKAEEVRRAQAAQHPATLQQATFSYNTAAVSSEEGARQARKILQDLKEKNEIAEAEAEPDATCATCGTPITGGPGGTASVSSLSNVAKRKGGDLVLRASVDEVSIFFAATDHGKSVTNLTADDIVVRDDNKAPHTLLGFRNESELPLRLGLVIDTSNSVTDRFSFEQAAAIKFLQAVVTDKNDLAFVVGVNNSVLMVQDFTADQSQAAHAISQLAPGGGTALWDAVAFAEDKLASRAEVQPVARILVVISDGEDNSSTITLKQAIASAQRSEVAIYTVSTREEVQEPGDQVGDHALRTLSELTGGAAFVPGSVRHLSGSLADLQQVIRGRYLVSYKPASFQRDGRYRSIDIMAHKDGRQLKVFSRKGYYASAAPPESENNP